MFCKTRPATERFRESTASSMAIAVFCSLALHVALFLSWSIESRKSAEHRPMARESLPSIRFSVALLSSQNVATLPEASPVATRGAEAQDVPSLVATVQTPQQEAAPVHPLPLQLPLPPMQEASREMVEQASSDLSDALPAQPAPSRSAGPFSRHRMQRDLRSNPAYRLEPGLDNRQEPHAPGRTPTP